MTRASIDGLGVRRRRQFVYAHAGLSLAAIVVLAAVDQLSLTRFFVVSFLGFLVLRELTSSTFVTPVWRRWLRWPAALGYLGFAAIVASYLRALFAGIAL